MKFFKILESNVTILTLIFTLVTLFPVWLAFFLIYGNLFLMYIYVPLFLLLLTSMLIFSIRKKWKKFFVYISLIALFSFSSYYLISKIGKGISDAYQYSYQMDSKISEMKGLVQNGDIIFQTSTSPQSLAIQKVTNSKYSHMGIIYIEGDYYYVYEAINKVKKTNLRDWIERGENSDCVVKRIKNAKNILSKSNLLKIKKIGEKYLGKNYDSHFEWSNEKMYCSELVWKLYNESIGIEIGELKELKDFDLSHKESKKIIDERKIKINPYEKVISPADMFDSDLLTTIYK
tara:strand:+ start:550 stop:1416 length:867 start_codon:yes stop_codon:yes gene_type:complete